jgi:hypothetical protein
LNLEKLTPWLTIAANVGLLAGMVLVAYEINQNSQLARITLVNEGNIANNQFWTVLMGEAPGNAIAMSVECPEAMTYSDFMVMDVFLFIGMNYLYRNFELAQEGIFTEEDWQELVESYTGYYLGSQFGQAWWDEEGRNFFADEFVNHVDMQLEGTARDSHSYWLGMRARLFGPGSNKNAVGASACSPQNDTPDSTNTAK